MWPPAAPMAPVAIRVAPGWPRGALSTLRAAGDRARGDATLRGSSAPGAVTMAGALAVAAITSSALSLLPDLDATLIILIWNLGTAALITGLGGTFGRRILRCTESHLLVS
jgi:hypothetical protein